MNSQLALALKRGLNFTDFVTAWNDNPLVRSQADAHFSSSRSPAYFGSSFLCMDIDFVFGAGHI